MGSYREIDGNLITMAKENYFDVIGHGCNCFCTMRSGIAPKMAKAFGCDKFPMEDPKYKGDINKLGCIDYKDVETSVFSNITVANLYTQYKYGYEEGVVYLNYTALEMCLEKMNHIFKGKRIGLPKIGSGKAQGDWRIIKSTIQKCLIDCDVTVINYTE